MSENIGAIPKSVINIMFLSYVDFEGLFKASFPIYSGTWENLYSLQDELGSVVKLIGEDGKMSSHYNYDEFGRIG
ncbi:MAG: hypothetical protein ACYC0N_00795 [Carboxydocellales bacterium]